MNISIFLASGDSITNLSKNGQDVLFIQDYLSVFSKHFEKIYIFSYQNEKPSHLPKNVELIPNSLKLNKYLYGLILPFIHHRIIKRCNVIRTYHLYGTVPAIIANVFLGTPYVFNLAYDYEKFARIDRKHAINLLLKILKKLAFLTATKIFVVNKTLSITVPPKKLIYLPNGVNIQLFKPKISTRWKTPLHILSVGRLEKQKNYESLIYALRGIKAKLSIIGGGSYKKRLLLLANKNKVSLEIKGPIPHNQMPKIYKSADIFVLPSLIEGHPKALLEAMSTSLPIIATNVEGNRDLIKDDVTGLLCETSAKSIHESLTRLIKNKKKATMLGQTARLTVDKEYNLKALLKREVQALKSIGQN